MSPDLIVTADTVHTLDPGCPAATAVAVTGGIVSAVGDRRDVAGWRGAGTQVIDLGTATVTPGLVDGHIHPVLGLDLTRGADLSAVRELASWPTRCAGRSGTSRGSGCWAGD